MRTRRKQALKILGISLPILGCGLYIFNPEGIANRFVEVLAIVSLILGLFGVVSGIVLFFTKNSLGLIETKPDLSPEELKNLNEAWDTAEKWMEEEPNDSWRKDTVWEKEEPVQEEEITAEEATLGILHGEDSNAEEPKLKMPS